MPQICVSCGKRRGTRHCPVLGGYICSRCCGEKRLVEISCPPTCLHLKPHEAFQREKLKARYREAWVKVNSDLADKGPELKDIFFLERAVEKAAERMGGVNDSQVEAGLSDLDARLSPIELISRPDTPFGTLLWELVSPPIEEGLLPRARLREATKRLKRILEALRDPHSPRAFIQGLSAILEGAISSEEQAPRFIITPKDI